MTLKDEVTVHLVACAGYLSFRNCKTSCDSLKNKDFLHLWLVAMDMIADPDAFRGLGTELAGLLFIKDGMVHCTDEPRLIQLSKQLNLLRKLKGQSGG